MGSWLFTCAKSSQGPAACCDIGTSILASASGNEVRSLVRLARGAAWRRGTTLPAADACVTLDVPQAAVTTDLTGLAHRPGRIIVARGLLVFLRSVFLRGLFGLCLRWPVGLGVGLGL